MQDLECGQKNIDAFDKINSFYKEKNEGCNKKAVHFDEICELFYKRNFGSASKSEIELLMFSIFMDEMIEHNLNDNGVLDYKTCSDYKIAEMLGIPQEKVKTLKVKKQARYPREFDWRESFLSIKQSIVYDVDKNRIIIPVSDPNLYFAIKNYIEEQDSYIEIQRGTNVIQLRPQNFFCLLYLGINESDKEKVKINFVKELKAKNEKESIEDILTDKEMIDRALSVGDDFLDFIENVVSNIDNPLMMLIKGIRTIGKILR